MSAVASGVLRVGVVGLGVMGRAHAQVLQALPGVAVTAVADVSDAAVAAVVERTGAVGTGDGLQLAAGADVDALVVASPDATHAALVRAALDRDLPVLCEKPLTTSVADSAALVELESGRGLVQVGFMRRHDPAFAAVADAVHAGRVGAPSVLRTVHRNPVSAYAFEPSVLWRNSASHDVDLVRWTTGCDVVEVSCEPAPDGPDFAAVLLRLRTTSGAVSVSELSYGAHQDYEVGLEVSGAGGVVGTPLERSPDWTHRFDEAYRRQLVAWVDAVRAGRTDPRAATAADGLAVTVVLEAADASWRAGGAPQRLTL
ncbi:Gfo/Idh/MocA family protein [Angustibacter aerolatus]